VSKEAETLHICNKSFELLEGTALAAPYVVTTIFGLRHGESVPFLSRLDLGADITCVPKSHAKKLMPLTPGRSVLIRAHDGDVKRSRTYILTVSICGCPDEEQVLSYLPKRGVLLTESDIGLIGMDLIRHWKLEVDGASEKFSISCV